ncbi:MAG: twin-arginine translocase TatA/TatE family subunit [Proteobacteria bacterium]|nr:twin-arginine translocase TatA/TatE family subunit [Pseudomonadota bacterium]
MGELVIILMLCLLVFGAARLPQIGEGMGKAIRNFKRSFSGDDEVDVTPTDRQVQDESAAKPVGRGARDAEVAEHKS